MTSHFYRSPQRYVRFAGLCYLAIICLGMFGELAVRGSLVVSGDAASTAQQISASMSLWRSGIVGDLMMHVLDIPIIVLLYLVFKRVSAGLNLTATFFNLIQTAVLVANKMTLIIPLLLLGGASYLSAFSTEQLEAFVYVLIRSHNYGFAIGLIFFGIACVIRGFLIIKSTLFPRFIGVMLALAGLCYLVNSLIMLLAPEFASLLFPWIMLPVFMGELTLSLWMIMKGVDLERWNFIQDN